MSYILDALRRAEADRERERGQVPGLNTQAVGKTAPAASSRRWLPWAGGGLLLLAGIGAGAWWASGSYEAVTPIAQPMPQPVPQPAPQPAPAPVTPPIVAAPAPQPAASTSPYLPPVPPPVAVAPGPAPQPAPVAAPAPAPVAAAVPAPVPAPPPPAPAPAAATEAPIPKLAELPENIRRDVPRIVISGSVYSDDPRGRFAMINGEVLREGAQIGPDHVLEQIRPRELIFRFKGQRYRQPT